MVGNVVGALHVFWRAGMTKLKTLRVTVLDKNSYLKKNTLYLKSTSRVNIDKVENCQ